MKGKWKILILGVILILSPEIQAAQKRPAYLNAKLPLEKRLDDLLARMTLEEKVGQMCQYVGLEHQREVARMKLGRKLNVDDAHGFYRNLSPKDVMNLVKEGRVGSFLHVVTATEANQLQKLALQSRLKIPLLIGIDAIHGNCLVQGATVYPTPITLASTWDPALVKEIGRQTAIEMRAEGMHWSFTPNVDVVRDPRWGRTGETFGEDPYLVSQMGVAMILGLQKENPTAEERVIACAKHMVGGGESLNGANAAPTDISRKTLFDIFLPPFQAAVDAGVYTIMAAHNEIEGLPCHGNQYLLTNVLRKRMGFHGFVVSDWMDIERLYNVHHVVPSMQDAYRLAVHAGVDMHMHGPGFAKGVVQLVQSGKIPESRINKAVRAILKAKFRLGLFEHRFVDVKKIPLRVQTKEHRQWALKAAREGIVLLKNDGLLPIHLKKGMKILITGPNANNHSILGDWSLPQPAENVITIFEGVQQVAGPKATVTFFNSGEDLFHIKDSQIKKAGELAKQADLTIVVVGSRSLQLLNQQKTSGENVDRAHIRLFGKQRQLVKAIQRAGKPCVVVLVNSRPLGVPWIVENVNALIEAWEPGEMGGRAVAEVIFGRVNPSGKLPVTIPRCEGQIQMVYNYKPSMYIHRTIDEKATPLFPFGFGLSYTQFVISGLKLNATKITKKQKLTATVSVKNIGKRAGSEIVQLYIRDEVSSYTRPVKELKGFARIFLKSGEQRSVTFTLDPQKLGFYDADAHYWVEPGWFTIMVGESSADPHMLKARFELVK